MASDSKDKEKVVRILVVGNSGVGKTSLLLRYTEGIEPGTASTTVPPDMKEKTVELETTKRKVERVRLHLVDTAGQERFGTLTSSLYRLVSGVLICYDITDAESFAQIGVWRNEVVTYAAKDTLVSLVGLKADLEVRRQIEKGTAKSTADSWHVPFFEASAKSNTNVDEAIEELARRCTVAQAVKDRNRDSGRDAKSRPLSQSQSRLSDKKPLKCEIL